jgi:hypothetical protein
MDKTQNSKKKITSFEWEDRDDRPWNNSWCRLLRDSRLIDKLRTILSDCEFALARLYQACNSDEVMEYYWDLQKTIIFLFTSCSATESFIAMAEEGRTRDVGQAFLCNGLTYFKKRVNDCKVILKALARPCSSMPREVFSSLSSAFAMLHAMTLYLSQDQKRKRAKKNRNKSEKPFTGFDKESDEYPTSEEEQGTVRSATKN